MSIQEKIVLPKGNDTCCHICSLCENPCSLQNQCTGACAGCPHPCWYDLKPIEEAIKKKRARDARKKAEQSKG